MPCDYLPCSSPGPFNICVKFLGLRYPSVGIEVVFPAQGANLSLRERKRVSMLSKNHGAQQQRSGPKMRARAWRKSMRTSTWALALDRSSNSLERADTGNSAATTFSDSGYWPSVTKSSTDWHNSCSEALLAMMNGGYRTPTLVPQPTERKTGSGQVRKNATLSKRWQHHVTSPPSPPWPRDAQRRAANWRVRRWEVEQSSFLLTLGLSHS